MRSKFKWILTLMIAFTLQLSFAQEKTVTGVVSDETGPLPSVNIKIKGAKKGIQSDLDGKYSIKASVGEEIEFSYQGMTTKLIKVGATSKVNVRLSLASNILETVVVDNGYRSQVKEKSTSAASVVGSKTINNRPNASFVQTLQGQVAGLNISSGSGQPGAASSILIRGAGSINGSTEPLFVIDGVPTSNNNFRSLNPNDIESATVLKDAAATAIYGNRGTNGVVIVKTRNGKYNQKMTFNYSFSSGLTSLQNQNYSMTSAQQQLFLENTIGTGRGSNLTLDEINSYNGPNTDWLNYFFKTGYSQSHQLSMSSGSENLASYTSLSYFNQDGILNTTNLQRFTLRNNLVGKNKDGKFTYNINSSIGYSKNKEANNLGTGAVNRNYVLGALIAAPYVSPSDYQNSQQLFDLYTSDGTLLYTPLMLQDKLDKFYYQSDELRILESMEATYKFNDNFSFTSRASADLTDIRTVEAQFPLSFNSRITMANTGQEYAGYEAISARREFNYNHFNAIRYSKVIASKHTIDASLNMEYFRGHLQSGSLRQRGLDPKIYSVGVGTGYIGDQSTNDFYVPLISALKINYGLLSYFATADYDYDKRFGVSVSIRRDGSSRFNEGYKWGNFWAISGRWNLDNESFMKSLVDNKIVNALKLRASVGTTGNQRVIGGTNFAGIIPTPYLDTYSLSPNAYNNQSGYAVNLGVADLRWETTQQWDIGTEFELLKGNRLRGTIDWYMRKTYDLYLSAPISWVTGQNSIDKNSDALLYNRGVEVQLSGDVVKTQDFTLTLNFLTAFNKSELQRVPNGELDNTLTTNKDGYMLDEFKLIRYAGVNPANGNLLFYDANDNVTETPSPDTDRVMTGKNRIPLYTGSFGFEADYKGFYMSTMFTYSYKVWRFDYDYAGLMDPTDIGRFRSSTELLNAWTPTNTETDVPSLTASNLAAADNSDRFLIDASYVRLRNIQLGYNVPQKFMAKLPFTACRIYAQGENLKTWTKWRGFDAESNRGSDQAQYPTPKIITFGLDLKF